MTMLLPVRNGALWLRECLASISAQTRPPAEVLVIDDGSVDGSEEIIRQWADESVRVLKGPRKGLFAALALGVEAATNELIARMDQDDVAHPERLAQQSKLLSADSTIVLCGSWARLISRRGGLRVFRPPASGRDVQRFMGLGNPIVHSSVMFRRSAVRAAGNYWAPDSRPYPEDYDLWLRLSAHGDIVNIPRYLVNYRVHESGLASTGRESIGRSAAGLALARAAQLLTPSLLHPSDAAVIRAYHRTPDPDDCFTASEVHSFLTRLAHAGEGPRSKRLFPVSTHVRLTGLALHRRLARHD